MHDDDVPEAFLRELQLSPEDREVQHQIVQFARAHAFNSKAPERVGRRPQLVAAGAVALILLGTFASVNLRVMVARHSIGGSANVSPIVTAPPPGVLPTPAGGSPSPPACAGVDGYPTIGTLSVRPACFHAGETVVIEGRGCHNPGAAPRLVFGNDGDPRLSGIVGAADPLPSLGVSSDDTFEMRYTIPATLHTYQGRGGGPLGPGTYSFWSEPPFCMAAVVVLGS